MISSSHVSRPSPLQKCASAVKKAAQKVGDSARNAPQDIKYGGAEGLSTIFKGLRSGVAWIKERADDFKNGKQDREEIKFIGAIFDYVEDTGKLSEEEVRAMNPEERAAYVEALATQKAPEPPKSLQKRTEKSRMRDAQIQAKREQAAATKQANKSVLFEPNAKVYDSPTASYMLPDISHIVD